MLIEPVTQFVHLPRVSNAPRVRAPDEGAVPAPSRDAAISESATQPASLTGISPNALIDAQILLRAQEQKPDGDPRQKGRKTRDMESAGEERQREEKTDARGLTGEERENAAIDGAAGDTAGNPSAASLFRAINAYQRTPAPASETGEVLGNFRPLEILV